MENCSQTEYSEKEFSEPPTGVEPMTFQIPVGPITFQIPVRLPLELFSSCSQMPIVFYHRVIVVVVVVIHGTVFFIC